MDPRAHRQRKMRPRQGTEARLSHYAVETQVLLPPSGLITICQKPMIDWILHRPPHASNPSEIRVAERLKGLADSPHAWTVILHAQSEITRSSLGDRRILGVHNLRECTEQEDAPNTIRHTPIHKAKGLDSKAVILIGLPPHRNLASDYDH